jgi:RNA polymerase sigma-70 factor (ECF subfamily)
MDRTNFHQLYEAHARDVHRFALYLTGSADQADDVTAEVFLRAWSGVETIRQPTARAYLIAAARNLIRDRARRSRRETRIGGDATSGEATGEERVEFEQTIEALRGLPEELREPLTMSALGGMSYEEVAAALGLTLATVKIRIFRARQRLAAEMGIPTKATTRVTKEKRT